MRPRGYSDTQAVGGAQVRDGTQRDLVGERLADWPGGGNELLKLHNASLKTRLFVLRVFIRGIVYYIAQFLRFVQVLGDLGAFDGA